VPVVALAELLDRWRNADSVWTRSQVITESAQRLRRLTPAERRVLAQALAQHGAPHAAASLDARTDGALSPAQVQTVIDELLTLDADRIGELSSELSSALQTSGQREGALAGVPPQVRTGRPADLPPPPGLTPPEAPATAADLPPPPRPSEPAAGREPRPSETAITDDLELRTDDDLGVWEEIDGRLHQVTAAVEPRTASEKVASPEPVATRDLGPFLEAVRTTTSAAQRRRLLDDLRGHLLTGDEVHALLDAIPDGWQRRRAACQLLELGTLEQVPPTVVLDRLSRTSDRRFVAGSLLGAGLLRPMELRGRLPSGTARRLAARAGR
jgi:hypothetical protein